MFLFVVLAKDLKKKKREWNETFSAKYIFSIDVARLNNSLQSKYSNIAIMQVIDMIRQIKT